MESKHKNALIGALLAVVFVMAVGYAAFAQQLTINGTAEITSNWDIHFKDSEISESSGVTVSCTNGLTSGTTCGSAQDSSNPYATVTRTSDTQMEVDAKLVQPGDVVTLTLHPHNYGTGLCATGTMTISSAAGEYAIPVANISNTSAVTSGSVTATKDHVKYTVTPTFASSLAVGSDDAIQVRIEYLTNQSTNETVPQTKAGIIITTNYSQTACSGS